MSNFQPTRVVVPEPVKVSESKYPIGMGIAFSNVKDGYVVSLDERKKSSGLGTHTALPIDHSPQ